MGLLLEDEFGDDVHVDFHDDETVEIDILAPDSGVFEGGIVLNKENTKRLVRRLVRWVEGAPDDSMDN
jgi:hypothetical protein